MYENANFFSRYTCGIVYIITSNRIESYTSYCPDLLACHRFILKIFTFAHSVKLSYTVLKVCMYVYTVHIHSKYFFTKKDV